MPLLDGAVGTELERAGYVLPVGAWSAAVLESHPDAVRSCHLAYAAAGAEIHTACTFRARPEAVGDRAPGLVQRAVAVARSAGGRVAGSLAPVADCYRPDLAPRDSREAHRAMARLLQVAGVDLLLCETFANPREALQATEVSLEVGLPVWLALTGGPAGDLMSPRSMAQTAREARKLGVSQVLVNCVAVDRIAPFVGALAETGVPFGVYANGGLPGEPYAEGAPGADERYALAAASWADAGARTLGGCCGTGPATVHALAHHPALGLWREKSAPSPL